MAWNKFPYPNLPYTYDAASLKKIWPRLHTGDCEAFPQTPQLVDAWLAFHAGHFEKAADIGLSLKSTGYAVANKATCIYINYLENSKEKKLKLYKEITARCEKQQMTHPDQASGYYWHAYALGRYAQDISIVEALADGIGNKVKHSLEMAIRLAPKHADAHIALGLYHAEIIDKVGALIGGLTYGASKDEGLEMFKKALNLNPDSAIARIEYANGLIMFEGKKKVKEALALYQEAADFEPMDAMERLDVQLAIEELADD
jgi:tetratricopeptide (TPR) repeat protein